jgi:glycosyltransferase involved in cell wall biosynthesis
MLLSLIVPCYNEQEALPLFYKEASKVLSNMRCDHEFLFINDGSRDGTLEIMKKLAAEDPHVFYYSFSRNFGKESAMYAGLCNARGDYVAVMDADMQDPPSLLPEMVRILETGEYDSVATRRTDRTGEPPVRSWFSKRFYSLINQISDADIVDGARDFRLMTRDMKDAVLSMGEYNRFSKGIFGWVGFRTYWLPYENVERVAGETKWSFWKLFKYAIDGIISFSQTPLSISSWFGILMTVFSFLLLIFIVLRRLIFGDPVAGWASTICVIIFIGGLQLFCLGIIGQYLAKTYMEVKNRPHYIVSDTNAEHAQKIR